MKLEVGSLIWLMIDNKPQQIIVSKIVETQELTIIQDEPRSNKKIWASISTNYNHDLEINEMDVFETKEALKDFVFNSEREAEKSTFEPRKK